jgi:hypothetical protein
MLQNTVHLAGFATVMISEPQFWLRLSAPFSRE